MNKKPTTSATISDMRRRAEASLGEPQTAKNSDPSAQTTAFGGTRVARGE